MHYIPLIFTLSHVANAYPMIPPDAHYERRSKCTRWVHAGARVLDLHKKERFKYTELRLASRVSLTAAKCPAVMDNPIANGADPLISVRRSSQTPCTTNTKMNVIKAIWIGYEFVVRPRNTRRGMRVTYLR